MSSVANANLHALYRSDLHLLLNTVHAPAVLNSPASWLPICLPRFNNTGFLHAYVTFPRQSDSGADLSLAKNQPSPASNAERTTKDESAEESALSTDERQSDRGAGDLISQKPLPRSQDVQGLAPR